MRSRAKWQTRGRLLLAFGIAALFLLLVAPGHGVVDGGQAGAAGTCAPETTTCVQVNFPCATTCSVTAGPVSGLGQDQAAYVEINDLPVGDSVGLALCSLAQGDQVVAFPQCATSIPPAPNCTTQSGAPCQNSPSPLQWEYGTVTTSQTVLSIGTEYDPDVAGAIPITSGTASQVSSGNYSSFFCDNGPSNPCGLLVVDIPPQDTPAISGGDGFPPSSAYPLSAANSVVIPLNWASQGNGCGSAPIMQVDASYSVAQFLPAAGEATCTGANGVAVIPTELPSVDDPACAGGGGTHCPITDVIDGTVPATFTDDPEDPNTLSELQKAGGTFAYIPVAISSTEIAFEGEAGYVQSGAASVIPLDTYELTPAEAAGVMTRFWTAPDAQQGQPNDDLCGQMTAKAHCTEKMSTSQSDLLVQTVNGSSANIDVSTAFGGTAKTRPFTTFNYLGSSQTFSQGAAPGTEKDHSGVTAYALLNPWPATQGNTPVSESTFGDMFPSTGSGSVFETTQWMCNAPDVGFPVNLPFGGSQSATDIVSSQQILADGELGPLLVTKDANGDNVVSSTVDQATLQSAKGCQAISSLPTDFGSAAQQLTDQYNPSSSPITAAHTISGAMSLYGGQGGFAFADMDSSEADFFGLLPASLQNAAGSFVAPTSDSVAAAVGDATKNADGTLTPAYGDTSDTAAYPLPMITYALVSTAPQPSMDEATQLSDMLKNVVNYSETGGAGTSEPLPAGYVPLPASLAQEALADIAKDVVGPGGATTSGGSSGGSGSSSSTTAAGGGSTAATSAAGTGASGGPAAAGGGPRGASSSGSQAGSPSGGSPGAGAATPAGSAGSTSVSANPVGHFITVTLGDDRFLVPGLLLLALLCLLLGPLLYASPSLRRSPDGSESDEGTEAARPPPAESG